jgi:hypothetical protein
MKPVIAHPFCYMYLCGNDCSASWQRRENKIKYFNVLWAIFAIPVSAGHLLMEFNSEN